MMGPFLAFSSWGTTTGFTCKVHMNTIDGWWGIIKMRTNGRGGVSYEFLFENLTEFQ